MRMRGLEPPRAFAHTDLNRARLPIPPHPRGRSILSALTPRPVVGIPEHREVLKVARDAALEVVPVTRFTLPLDERQVTPAPAAPAPSRALALPAAAKPRPFGADDESDGAGKEHDRDDGHGIILVRG
jgi:hypothetical protein